MGSVDIAGIGNSFGSYGWNVVRRLLAGDEKTLLNWTGKVKAQYNG